MDRCLDGLGSYLRQVFQDFQWALDREDWPEEKGDSLWLLDRAQSRMAERRWQFCFVTADEQVEEAAGGGPGVISLSFSVAVIYLSQLCAGGGDEDCELLSGRTYNLILAYFARLNGLPRMQDMETASRPLSDPDIFDGEEIADINKSLHGLSSGLLARGVKEIMSLALYVRVLFRHPVRVARSVLDHRPWVMVLSLGRLAFAAVAALVLALLSAELWYLGVGINIWRLVLIAVVVLLGATFYVVLRQRLYVRRVSLSHSEQAAFFNLTSFFTVLCVFITLLLAIFAATSLASFGIYPRYIVREWLQKGEVSASDYIKVSLLVSSLVMVVGALGAGLEENQHFRRVMYTEKNR
ncbi:MAG: hypothetical protein SWK76_12640 [Actinomycetota bacterium]|nr:hypothetical protein [Actinomycetota bacterium]